MRITGGTHTYPSVGVIFPTRANLANTHTHTEHFCNIHYIFEPNDNDNPSKTNVKAMKLLHVLHNPCV